MTTPLSAPQAGRGEMSVARGSALMLLFKLIARSIGFVSTLILARLLTPADFGLVAMAMSVVALTELIGAFGFDTALIQRQDAERAHFDTAWTLNLLSATVIALLLLVLTLPAAAYYAEPRLHLVMPVLAVGALIAGFENIGIVNFRKQMDFASEFRFLVARQVSAFVVTIPLALAYRSFWALIAGTMASKVFAALYSYRLHPYRPRFSLAKRGDLFHFSKWLLVANVIVFLQNRSSDFILGRTVGPHGLGLYTVAFEIAVMPSTEMIAPVNRAVFPAYARIASDAAALRARFLQVYGIIALIAFPLCVGLACVARPAVLAVLGEQWIDAIPLLRLFTLAGLAAALQSNLTLMLVALGRPKASTLVFAATLAVFLPVLVVASLTYGVIGAAWAYVLFAGVGFVAVTTVFLLYSGVRARDYLDTLIRPFAASLVMAAVVVGLDRVLVSLEPTAFAELFVLMLAGALTYGFAVMVLWALAGKPGTGERVVLDVGRRMASAIAQWRAPERANPSA
jgi:O-antigen/teichoic acid export membrane protein